MGDETENNDKQQRFAIRHVREIDIYDLTQRGLGYVETSRKRGLLTLENSIKDEPLDIFREALELLVDGCSADEIRQFLTTSKKQTLHHIETLFSLVENMTVSAKEGDNPKLVKRYAQLYFTGEHLAKLDKS
jgi:flagellar motor component MotA